MATVKDRLENIANNNSCNESDEILMQNLLRQCGFPKCVVTYGIVYLEGYGHPIDIQSTAKMILKGS